MTDRARKTRLSGAFVTPPGLKLLSSEQLDTLACALSDWRQEAKGSRSIASRTVTRLRRGSVLTAVHAVTPSKQALTTIVTNHSVEHLGLEPGVSVEASVKASLVMVAAGTKRPRCSADNAWQGKVTSVKDDGCVAWRRLVYRFQGEDHSCSTPGIFLLSLIVGVVGGVYGIGGGAIIAPFFVAIYKLPVHTVAGATLMGTFVTSIVGVLFYQMVAPYYGQMSVAPDWLLGGLFGVGGFFGMYLGARMQRFVPAKWIKVGLAVLLVYLAVRYLAPWISSWLL